MELNSRRVRMDIATTIATLNRLLTSKEPVQFNSSWIWATRTALLSVYTGEFPPRIRFAVDTWIERHETIARWGGHEEKLQD